MGLVRVRLRWQKLHCADVISNISNPASRFVPSPALLEEERRTNRQQTEESSKQIQYLQSKCESHLTEKP